MEQDPAYQNIGYESGSIPPTGEEEQGLETYSPKEMARLWSYEHALRQANEVEERISNHSENEWWWVSEDKTVKKLLWRESPSLVETIRKTADHMYHGNDVEDSYGNRVHVPGFVDEPKMAEAADQLKNNIQQEKEQAREFEISELNHLFNLP